MWPGNFTPRGGFEEDFTSSVLGAGEASKGVQAVGRGRDEECESPRCQHLRATNFEGCTQEVSTAENIVLGTLHAKGNEAQLGLA